MDIDHYIADNEPGWRRLAELTSKAQRRVRDLGPGELDELLALYQRSSAQLSYVRTYYRDPILTARLTRLVAAASGVVYSKRTRSMRAVSRFFAQTFPAACWYHRRAISVAALALFVPAIVVAVWLLNDPVAMDASGSPTERRHYVEEQFEQYYSDRPSAQFFTEVTFNNIQVGYTAFALGGLACIPGALIIGFNGANLGAAAAWMISEGDALRFWGLILPHGALELTAIAIAGGAGLALGWSWIAPGDRTRGRAFMEEGRRSVVIALGVSAAFVAAGIIEGFVTGTGLPAAVRVAVGVAGWGVFMAYLVVQGRKAAALGLTGAMGEEPMRSEPGRDLATGARSPSP